MNYPKYARLKDILPNVSKFESLFFRARKKQIPPIQGPVLDCEWMGVCGIFRNLGPNSVNMDPSLAHDDRISDQRAGRKWVRGTF